MTFPEYESRSQDSSEDKALRLSSVLARDLLEKRTHDNDSHIVPRLRVPSPLQREDQGSDRGENESSTEPVHVEGLTKDGARRAVVEVCAKRRRGLQKEGDGDEGDSTL